MLMDEGMDTGPSLLTRKISIGPEDTGESLGEKMAPLGAELLLETLDAWEQGKITPQPQDDSLATKAPIIKKEHARIDWNLRADEIDRRIRAFKPWPGAYSEIEGATVKVHRAKVGTCSNRPPGETLVVDKDGIVVACGSGTGLRLVEVQAQGKKKMAADAFARGQRITPGTLWT